MTRSAPAQPDLFALATPSQADLERAFLERDAAFDGQCVAADRTTGVFCRMSCSARTSRRDDVELSADTRDVLAAGYRPCRRCRPTLPAGTTPAWVTRLLDAIDEDPRRGWHDVDVAQFEVVPAHAQQFFREHFGVGIQAYARGQRRSGAQRLLDAAAATPDASPAGWRSHAEFADALTRATVSTRSDAAVSPIVTTVFDTPLGPLLAGATDAGLHLLEFTHRRMLDEHVARLTTLLRHPLAPGEHPTLVQTHDELTRYFAGTLSTFTAPLVFHGTPFEERVWHGLTQIPYGEAISYGELARRIDTPDGQRAVGRANGLNRISIVIPCHRVVNSDGKLGGYGGGLWRKHWLLALERRSRDAGTDC